MAHIEEKKAESSIITHKESNNTFGPIAFEWIFKWKCECAVNKAHTRLLARMDWMRLSFLSFYIESWELSVLATVSNLQLNQNS